MSENCEKQRLLKGEIRYTGVSSKQKQPHFNPIHKNRPWNSPHLFCLSPRNYTGPDWINRIYITVIMVFKISILFHDKMATVESFYTKSFFFSFPGRLWKRRSRAATPLTRVTHANPEIQQNYHRTIHDIKVYNNTIQASTYPKPIKTIALLNSFHICEWPFPRYLFEYVLYQCLYIWTLLASL